tara:strand:- start:13216 stop:13401 length:186 start_codon:yes stop_codon:yes gene_type:complete
MNHDEHVYWYHKHTARKAFEAANRLANETHTRNVKRKHQPTAVVALYAVATTHATTAADMA